VLHHFRDAGELTPETTFDDIGADAIDRAEILNALEDEFGVTITEEQSERLPTLGAVVALLDRLT
jgi:acyl carrier protein